METQEQLLLTNSKEALVGMLLGAYKQNQKLVERVVYLESHMAKVGKELVNFER